MITFIAQESAANGWDALVLVALLALSTAVFIVCIFFGRL